MLELTPNNQNYPNSLGNINKPPQKLYVQSSGWDDLVKMPALAVVGARKPTAYGAAVCSELVRAVASRGVCIVSGLALGIDSIAHRAALEVGGSTIAVLPSGFDKIYPASHASLAENIVRQGGALISEYPPKQNIAHKSYFIARNRIIAGLSQAVLIPEAAHKSGSLHTAQFAIDIGIDVLAVPGQITNPMASGTNELIKSGATIVTDASDILSVLGISDTPHANNHKITASNPEEYAILLLISQGVHNTDELLDKSKLGADIFNQTLTMLEITGRVKPGGGATWYLTNL